MSEEARQNRTYRTHKTYKSYGSYKSYSSNGAIMPTDALALRRIDHVRFFVGNARQSAYFYRNAFGFEVLGYAGLETGVKHEAGYVLRQGQITFVLTSPLSREHPECQRLASHGDGVIDVALEVDDVRAAYQEAIRRGAISVAAPARPMSSSPGRPKALRKPSTTSTARATMWPTEMEYLESKRSLTSVAWSCAPPPSGPTTSPNG